MEPTKDELKTQRNNCADILRQTQNIVKSQNAFLSEAEEKATLQEEKIAKLKLQCKRLYALTVTLSRHIDGMIDEE